MSVKNQDWVQQYVSEVADIRAALANMLEFVDSLPAPNGCGELPTLHYGHLGTVSAIHHHLATVSRLADEMHQRG